MRLRAVTTAVVGSIFALSTVAVAQEARSTRQREALRPRDANRVVQADLLSIFEPVKKIERGMFTQLRGVGLTTKAFGTAFDGLCRRDDVTLWYAPTRDDLSPVSAPVQPYSVEAQAEFHFTKLPQKEPHLNDDPTSVWRDECERAGRSENANWFTARDVETAILGTLALKAALEAVRSGALKAAPCPTLFDQKSTCEEAILTNGDPAKLSSIESCSPEPGAVCFEVQLDFSTELTIKARDPKSGSGLTPSDVTSIAIQQFVIVT